MMNASWLPRVMRYAFWTAGGALLPLALDRLVIHPAMNRLLGAEAFGAFLWVLGIVSLFGNVNADGLSTLLMRDMARESADRSGRMLRTAITLNLGMSTFLVAVVLSLSLVVADHAVLDRFGSIYPALAVYALARAGTLLLLSNMRIKRRFGRMFACGVIEAVVLSTILLLAERGSLGAIGSIYALSALLVLAFALASTEDVRAGDGWRDEEWVRHLLGGVGAGALVNLLNGMQLYLSRIALGMNGDLTEVAVFYAGASMANLFVVPVTVLSSLVLSLLGGRSTNGMTRRERRLYFIGSFCVSTVVGGAAYYGGGWLIGNRFPDLAERAILFYHWLAMGSGALSLLIMTRPLVVKFGDLGLAARVATICFAAQVVTLALLVPSLGGAGAALAQFLSCATGAVAWIWMAVRLGEATE